MPNVLRASVTQFAGGVNLCVNGDFATDTSGWYFDPATPLALIDPVDNPLATAALGEAVPGAARAQGAISPPTAGILTGGIYTISLYVRVTGPDPVVLTAETESTASISTDGQWQRLRVRFVARSTEPTILITGPAPTPGSEIEPEPGYDLTGCLIQPGGVVSPYTSGGSVPGEPTQILIDGSETPITANGLEGYTPTPGDRLLVQRVGSLVEVIQFLTRGSVPTIDYGDITELQAQVLNNTDDLTTTRTDLSDTQATALETSDTLVQATADINEAKTGLTAAQAEIDNFKDETNSTLSTYQSAFDALSGIGNQGVEEDYIWVGDNPDQATVKSVQISQYVQVGLGAGNSDVFGSYFGVWTKNELGDIEYGSFFGEPPMTAFYQMFTDADLPTLPYNTSF